MSTEEEAEKYGMAGSPTVLINGRDVTLAGLVGLEYRMYQGADGEKEGWPELELIRWALEAGQTPLACCG